MKPEALRELLRRRPFIPFEVRMSSGEVYQVRYPDTAFVNRSLLVISDPESDNLTICALDQMATATVPQ
ncbi:MAG: hypothetical protein L0Y71_24395 [Gemmataceae bacterium]|nr:hypothetical protein [Gemmataceae bacterium]